MIIPHGKYVGRRTEDMKTEDEIQYMRWYVLNVINHKKLREVFKHQLKFLGKYPHGRKLREPTKEEKNRIKETKRGLSEEYKLNLEYRKIMREY